MFRKADNKFFAAIGDNSLTSALPAAGTVITSANLPNGAIVVTDLGLRRLDDSTANADLSAMGTDEKFMIVQGKGASAPLLKSEAMVIGNTTITQASHVISRQQVTVIGYNGTTGSLPVANDTSYFVKIRKNDNDAANRSQPASKFGQFKTDASGTQEEFAFGMVANLNKNFELEPANDYVKAEVVGDGTVAVHAGSSVISYFTNGSTTVTVWTKATDATGDLVASTATVTADDIVNVPSSGGMAFTFTAEALGSSAGSHAVYINDTVYVVADGLAGTPGTGDGTPTTNGGNIADAINAGTLASATSVAGLVTIVLKPGITAFPMVLSTNDDSTWVEIVDTASVPVTITVGDANEVKYKVAATTVAAASYELTTPYKGATGYFYEGLVPVSNTGIATATNYGIKLTGIQADFNVATFRDYYVNRFTATFSDASTLVTLVQGARTGTGMGYQAQMDEYMTMGYAGQNEMIGIPPQARDQVANQLAEYSVVNIRWTEDITGLVSKSGASGNVLIYCELNGDSTLPATNASGEVADVLGEIASPVFASTDLNK